MAAIGVFGMFLCQVTRGSRLSDRRQGGGGWGTPLKKRAITETP